jgi:hypothetical protein
MHRPPRTGFCVLLISSDHLFWKDTSTKVGEPTRSFGFRSTLATLVCFNHNEVLYSKRCWIRRSILPISQSLSSPSPHLRVSYNWPITIRHLFCAISQKPLNPSSSLHIPLSPTYQGPPSSLLVFPRPLSPALSASQTPNLSHLPISWYPLFLFLGADQ